MKVVAINGSPRKGGNTEIMIRKLFEPLEAAGIETELIRIGGKAVRGCTACMTCDETRDGTCVITKDPVNKIIRKLIEADGIVLGSPTYFTDVTSEIIHLCIVNARTKGLPPGNRASPSIVGCARGN